MASDERRAKSGETKKAGVFRGDVPFLRFLTTQGHEAPGQARGKIVSST